jgi:hypothetical protein
LLDCIFNLLPMSSIRSNHGFMLEIRDHWDEDTPSFNFLADTHERIAFTISNFDWLKSSPHLFNLVLDLSQVNLSPLEFEIVIESVLTLLDVLP